MREIFEALSLMVGTFVGIPLTTLLLGNMISRPIDWLAGGWLRRAVEGNTVAGAVMVFLVALYDAEHPE